MKPTVPVEILTPVYVLEFGKWSYRALGQLSEERRAEFWKYFAQLLLRTQRDATMCNEQGVIYIDDMDTFRLEHYVIVLFVTALQVVGQQLINIKLLRCHVVK